jgi:hypothetical protein
LGEIPNSVGCRIKFVCSFHIAGVKGSPPEFALVPTNYDVTSFQWSIVHALLLIFRMGYVTLYHHQHQTLFQMVSYMTCYRLHSRFGGVVEKEDRALHVVVYAIGSFLRMVMPPTVLGRRLPPPPLIGPSLID